METKVSHTSSHPGGVAKGLKLLLLLSRTTARLSRMTDQRRKSLSVRAVRSTCPFCSPASSKRTASIGAVTLDSCTELRFASFQK